MIKRWIPTAEQVRASRWVSWLGPRLHDHRLWHLNRRGVALGVAVGVFFGLLIPIAQIPLAAVTALALRANLWAAAASTLITNPITFAPVYYLAYHVGVLIVGGPESLPATMLPGEAEAARSLIAGALDKLGAHGLPLLVGLAVMAVVMSAAAYFATRGLWRLRVALLRRRRARRRKA